MASPLLTRGNYDALIREAQGFGIDPRIALAWMLWEDHFGTDPNGGIALARVFNFGGIKWAGQAGAFDSGIEYPHSEGPNPMGTYTYAGFRDAGAWFHELFRTLTNQYCGPYFNAGDLANAASVYITGKPNSGHGQERVDTYREYVAAYPADPTPVPAPVPPPAASPSTALAHIRDAALAHVGDTITLEGYPEFGMCEQFVEEMLQIAIPAVTRVRYYSAADHGDVLIAAGVLRQGPWPAGAILVFGRRFDPNGHICVGDDFPFVITTYPGVVSRLDATAIHWYPNDGLLGWYIPEGATDGGEDDMALPRDAVIDDGEIALAWSAFGVPLNPDAAIFADWKQKVYGEGLPLGIPVNTEQGFEGGARMLQPFSSGLVAQWTAADGKVIWLGRLA